MQPQNSQMLAKLLKYHLLGGTVLVADMHSGLARTVLGSTLIVRRDAVGVLLEDGGVNTARVTLTDMVATNGVMHGVDTLLVPPELVVTAQSILAKSVLTPAPTAGADAEQTLDEPKLDLRSTMDGMPEISTLMSMMKRANLLSLLEVTSRTGELTGRIAATIQLLAEHLCEQPKLKWCRYLKTII